MKKRKTGPLLFALFLVLWAAAMVALVVIGFTNIQPKGIGTTATAPSSSSLAKDSHHG